MSSKKLLVVGLLVSIVIAGFLSFYASSQPDGLEKVSADQGLDVNAVDSANSGSALADYGVAGVENERTSAFLGGLIGVAITGLAGAGLYFWLRDPNTVETK
jgi:cobalt/nickel transport system permease protein